MLRKISLFLILTLFTGVSCRRKDKPTPLSLLPEEAAVVAWLPEPRASVQELKTYLAVFDNDSLGEQLRLLRADTKKQSGFDPLDVASMEAMGLDVEKPWAFSVDKATRKPVVLLALKDADTFTKRFTQTLQDGQLRGPPRKAENGVLVFAQSFGNSSREQFALRTVDGTALITQGEGGAAVLSAWPLVFDENHRSFQKVWRKSESDGSPGGAALRIVARDGTQALPPSLRAALGSAGPQNPHSKIVTAQEPELRCALSFSPHKMEFFAALIGTRTDLGLKLMAPASTQANGLPGNAVVFAHSSLAAKPLYDAVHELQTLAPLMRLADAAFGPDALARIAATVTGEAALAISVRTQSAPSSAKTTRERMQSVLDLFPMVATAQLRDAAAFDTLLGHLAQAMNERHIPATFAQTEAGAVLKASPLPERQNATLARAGDLLLYGVGPNAFADLQQRVKEAAGIGPRHPRFFRLFQPQTSGVMIDLHALALAALSLPSSILGEQSPLAKSFEHFDTLALTVGLEGPALGPHLVMRAWLSTR